MGFLLLIVWNRGENVANNTGMPNDSPNFVAAESTSFLPLTLMLSYRPATGQFANDNSTKRHFESAAEFDAELQKRVAGIDERFEAVFGLHAKGFDRSHIDMGKAALSNLLGERHRQRDLIRIRELSFFYRQVEADTFTANRSSNHHIRAPTISTGPPSYTRRRRRARSSHAAFSGTRAFIS